MVWEKESSPSGGLGGRPNRGKNARTLRLSGRFELLHLPLSAARWLVRILRSVVQPLVLAMLNARHDLSLRRTIAGKLVGDHNAGRPHLLPSAVCAIAAWRL